MYVVYYLCLRQVISYEEGKAFAERRKLDFFEASVEKNLNINEVFETMTIKILKARGLDVFKRDNEILLALHLIRQTDRAVYRNVVQKSCGDSMLSYLSLGRTEATVVLVKSAHANVMNRLPEDVARVVLGFL
jgi:hypothetical protein